MTCLVPGCTLGAEPCGFCAHHVNKLPVVEREHIVAVFERITGRSLHLPAQPKAVQGEIFGGPRMT